MPPHQIYIESHLGGGAVMRHKRPAARQIGIDIDSALIERWQRLPNIPCELNCTDATNYLEAFRENSNTLIYADPPYLPCTRRRAQVYRYDYSDHDHERLIGCLLKKSCMVMVSGYENDLYNHMLSDWNKITFRSMSHIGLREEVVWYNFTPPTHLHDSSKLGKNFRERELIRRRHARLRSRIRRLPLIEQNYLLEWLRDELKETA